MKKIWSKNRKRFIALLLLACIVISNSNITAVDVLAEEEPEKKQYTFVCKIDKTEKEISDSEVNIEVYEGDKKIEKTGNAYELEMGKEYKYKITSSSSKFSSLDVQNNFTANTDETITVFIPLNKLNIKMEDKKCYKGQSVSMFEADDWDLDWEWTSSNTEVATVDSNGNVATFQEGETTITKTSKLDSNIINSAKVTVTNNKVNCSLIFSILNDEGIGEQLNQKPEHVTIKKDNNIIIPDENGNYSLIPNDRYEIEIQDTGIILEKNFFDVPEYKDDAVVDITIQLGLVEPTFTINGKPIEEVEKMKKDSTITLKCINYDSLYQKDDWNCTINGNVIDLSVESEWSVENTLGSSDGFQIDYNCKKNDAVNYIEKRKNISIFDKYNFITMYDDEIVNLDSDQSTFTIKDKENNIISIEQMKINDHYTISVSSTGFNDNTVEVTTEFNQQEIFVTLGDIIPPKFQNVEEYCGGKISLKYNNGNGMVEEPYHELWEKWDWECIKEDDPNEKLSVIDSEIDLSNAKPGKYILTCKYNNIESNPVTVTVKKIRLKIDWESWENQWNPEREPYSASKLYEVSPNLNIKNDSYIKIVNEENVEKDKGNYSIDSNDCIVITGELDSEDVGIYNKLSNIKIEIQGEKEKYDLSEIENELNGTLIFKNKQIEIYQLDTTITFDNNFVPLLYRSHELAYKEGITINSSKEDESKRFTVLEELCRLMGKAVIIDTQYCKFNGGNIEYDGSSVYIENDDIKIIFENGWVIYDDSPKFKYEYIPENLHLSNIFQVCSFTQKNKNNKNAYLFNNNWCISNNDNNEYPIIAELKEGTDYNSEDGYEKVTFNKLDNVNNWEDLLYTEISKGNMGSDELDIRSLEEEAFYEVIFSKDDGQFATTAAIIRIFPEKQWDSNYPTLLEVGDGSYPVVNLFLDETPPMVNFLDSSLNRENDTDPVIGAEKNINEIEFTVESIGFDVESITYGFCKLDGEKEKTDIRDISVPSLKKISLKNNKTYTVTCPDTEGDYALYVRTKDQGGNQRDYVSNGFFVDRTAPQITSTFAEIEGDKRNLTESINDNQEVYTNQGIHSEFTLIEPHLVTDTVEVTITAEDRNGQVISSLDSDISQKEEKIRKDLSEKRKEKQTAICDFTESANYTVTIKAEDKIGLPIEITYKFTVDKEAPEEGFVSVVRNFHEIQSEDDKKKGKIKLIFKRIQDTWDALLENIVYNLFSQDEIKVTLTGSDKISPVHIYYYITVDKLTEEQLKNVKEENWMEYSSEEDKKPKIAVNRQEILYGKIIDKAGNASYFCTDGMITDNKAPEVTLTISKTANENDFYNGDIPFSAYIEEKIPDAGTGSAGLQYVSYRIEKGGSVSESKVVYDAGNNPNSEKKNCSIRNAVIDGTKFNNNNVALYVTAVDNAGNKEEIKKNFQIDTVKPEISVTYDTEESQTKYYTSTRTATITIKERNLDIKDVDISVESNHGSKVSIGKWTHSSNIGKSDDATYTCKVNFSKDDDYKFTVSCIDQAGNKAVKNFTDEFTIDTTKPVIAVSYSKETPSPDTYYNEPVTATITITERNFDAGKVNIQNNAEASSNSGISGTAGFSSNGDTHTATIQYDKDGIYGLAVTYTDEAGNQADSYSGNNFTIDLTEPEIKITNIENRSANKDAIQPVIICTDTNYDGEKVSITVKGSNNGEMELKNLGYVVSNIENGQQFAMDFPKTEELDDVYTLTAKVIDKAGNEKESSIDFSVNRYGSVYTIGTETEEWLTNGECSYIKEGKSVVIIETNVDEITDQNISYTIGGIDASIVDIKELGECSAEEKEKGAYYKESKVNTNGQWYQSKYEINSNNFVNEGKYTIQIDSTDKAGNHTNNVSNKHSGSNLNIEFAVDQTAPSVVVSGATDGAIYNEESHTLLLDVQDNLAMDYITVYLNAKEYGTYKKEDIEKMKDGLIPVIVKQSLSTQKLQVVAKDMAGNILGKDAGGAYDKTFDDFKILVTQNLLVRFLHTTWLMIIVLLAAICGLCCFIIIKRKKKQD